MNFLNDWNEMFVQAVPVVQIVQVVSIETTVARVLEYDGVVIGEAAVAASAFATVMTVAAGRPRDPKSLLRPGISTLVS